MKRSKYLYVLAILVIAAFYVYAFISYFWIMTTFIIASSLFSFMVFLVKTRITNPITDALSDQETVDFYKTETRTSYYADSEKTYFDNNMEMPFFNEQTKQANAS